MGRPGATKHRSRARKRKQGHSLGCILSGLGSIVQSARITGTPFGQFLDGFFLGTTPTIHHCGDLLPIPSIDAKQVSTHVPGVADFAQAVATVVNFSLTGTNFLYGGMRPIAVPRKPTAAQRHAQVRLVLKWWTMARHASSASDYMDGFLSASYFRRASEKRHKPTLVADKVDGIDECGQVDPMPCLPRDAQMLFSSPSDLFPNGTADIPKIVAFKGTARDEYAKLVCAQLGSRKVALMLKPTCAAEIFVVAKKEAERLREVWNGSVISAASTEPLAPPLLADPSALIALESSWDAPIYMSTRDGACFYDQLQLPRVLSRYFGRPEVKVCELLAGGISTAALAESLLDGDVSQLGPDVWVTPVSITLAMGFAHSAYVAQQVMVSACLEAGFTRSQFLSNARSFHDPNRPCVTVATDDVNVFSRLSRTERDALTELPMQSLDEVWKKWNIKPKDGKSVDLARSGAMLGNELVNGMRLLPKSRRLGALLGGFMSLLSTKRASPASMHEFVGVVQWSFLANRFMLSCFSGVYEFVEREPCGFEQAVPAPVLDELCVGISLFGYLSIDLTRPWSANVFATDGSQDFGFGMACAACHPSWTRKMAGHCADMGQGIIPDGVDVEHPSVRAVRVPLHLPYGYDEFVPCISVRAKTRDDAPTMEAVAFTLAMRRVTRCIRHHARRHVFLLDAMALIGALRKGRSSSRAFKVQLQKTGAMVLCADILPYFGYVPTSCNPGDPPSRCVKRSSQHVVQNTRSSWQQYVQSLRRSLRHLRASPVRGLPGSLCEKGSFDSSSSDSCTAQPDVGW